MDKVLDKNIIVRAGAGAGKTTRLTAHVFDVVREFQAKHNRYPKLVVTTFTRKATQELRERLILKACEAEDAELIQYVSDNSSLFISTIHGVLSQFLRKYAHLVDLDNSFNLVQPYSVSRQAKKIIRDLVSKNTKYYSLLDRFGFESLHKLCRSFYEAKQQNENLAPVDIQSFERLTRQVYKNEGEKLLLILESILAETEDEKWKLFCEGLSGIVRQSFVADELPNPLELLAQIKTLGSKPRVSKKNPQVSEELDLYFKEGLKEYKSLLQSDFLNTSHWKVQLETYNLFNDLGEEFTKEFFDFKKVTGQFEMQDLELLTLSSIRKEPRLGEAFSAEYDYWLIDEFQDTSPLQVELLKPLVGENKSFIVGDPQQSIYLFRGANSELFSEREKQIKEEGGDQNYLIKNYRSQPELLEFFNSFFARMGRQFSSMDPRDEIKNPQKVVASIAICKETEELSAEDQEMQAIAHRVQALLSEGWRFDDICILSRTHKQLEKISLFLQSFNIPTHIHSNSGFYQRREVIDLLFLIKFLINPHDNLNLVGLLRSPWFYVDDSLMASLLHGQGPKESLWQKLKEEENPSVQSLRQLFLENKQVGISETLLNFVQSTEYLNTSLVYDPTGRRESNIWKLVHLLKEEEKNPGFTYIDFVNQTLETSLSTEGSEDGDAVASIEPNRVNLMTIHASKGLKFNHVLIPFMHKRPNLSNLTNFNFDISAGQWSFPVPLGDELKLTNSIADWCFVQKLKERELQESDRVLYVAFTRAVESVFLSWQDKVMSNSWVDRVDMDFSEGLKTNEKFSYEVSYGPWEAQLQRLEVKESQYPRKVWEEPIDNLESHKKVKHSVSSLLESDWEQNEKNSSKPFRKPLHELLKGTQEGVLIHRLMENLKYNFDYDFSDLIREWFPDQKEDINKALEYVKDLKVPYIKEILANGQVEWGFQLSTAKGILEGQIDLWGKDDQGVIWVVDYKSGSEKYADKAFQQLSYYAEALQNLPENNPDTIFRLAVIYPMKQKVLIKDY